MNKSLLFGGIFATAGWAAVVFAGLSCGSRDRSDFDVDPSAPEPPPQGTLVGDAGPPPILDTDKVECAEETKQIYVLGTDKGLYRFYPDQLKFTRVGTLG